MRPETGGFFQDDLLHLASLLNEVYHLALVGVNRSSNLLLNLR